MTYEDIFAKCNTDAGYFGAFRAAGDRTFTMPVIDSVPGSKMTIAGKQYIMWSINNYLGLWTRRSEASGKRSIEIWSTSGLWAQE